MLCPSCLSDNQTEFSAEMMVHFLGKRNIDNPGVLLFQKVSVCLNCGFSKFTIPKSKLQKLNAGNAKSTAA